MNVGIPPRSRNQRLPAADDAPTASAASSLLRPLAISCQNSRSTSRRSDGFPGDCIGALPVNSLIHPAGLPINTTSTIKVLRAPVESSLYALIHDPFPWTIAELARDMGKEGFWAGDAVAALDDAGLVHRFIVRRPGEKDQADQTEEIVIPSRAARRLDELQEGPL